GMGRSLISSAAMSAGPYGEADPVGSVLSDPERRKGGENLLNDCRRRVRALLEAKRHVVEGIRDALLDRDEIIGDEIEVLMASLCERQPYEVPRVTCARC